MSKTWRAGPLACAKGPCVRRVPDAQRGVREGRAAAPPRRGLLRPELLRALRAGRGAPRRRRRRAPGRGSRRRGGHPPGRRPLALPRPRGARAAGARRAVRRRRGAGRARRRRAPAGARRPGRRRRGRRGGRGPARALPAARAAATAARAGASATRSRSTRSSPIWPSLGYERVEQVRARGEYAVRGGLIDVYPALGDPLRVEFWGDEVESLRTFSVYSQRTTGTLDASDDLRVVRGRHDPARVRDGPAPGARRLGARGQRGGPGRALPARRRARPGGPRRALHDRGRRTRRRRPGHGRVQPGRDLPGAGRVRRRGRHGGRRRGRARAALRAARRGPRPPRRRPAGGPRAARPAPAVPRVAAAVRGARHRRRRA